MPKTLPEGEKEVSIHLESMTERNMETDEIK
jgi:hypothetical protein